MRNLRAGAGKVDITPSVGVELSGYGYYLRRNAENIHDSLYARSVVLDNSSEKIALIGNDLIGLTEETVDRARSLIEFKTGIKKENIIVCASHTHSGPATAGLMRGLGEPSTEYLDVLPIKIANAAIIAAENLKEARIGFGKGKVNNVSYNRGENPNWWIEVKRRGTIDPELNIAYIDDINGEPLALLLNFACHPIVIDRQGRNGRAISADYPGYAQRMLEETNKEVVAIFLQGACGDINPKFTWCGFSEAAKIGESLIKEVMRVRKEIETTAEAEIRIRRQSVALPYNLPDLQEMGKLMAEKIEQSNYYSVGEDSKEARLSKFCAGWANLMFTKLESKSEREMKTELQALRINDTVLVTIPGELFVEFGLKVKKEVPYKNVLVVGLANDYVGYIPTEKDYEQGGYAAKVVPQITGNFPFVSNIGSILIEQILRLISDSVISNP